jgi:glucosamine 6-phosphate synthetase-like amidotransferase/phosphosugar isomerase protein
MCGIVGYAGHRQAADVLIEGLTRLEYRGYDSAGIAVLADGTLASLKRAGKLSNPVKALAAEPPLRGNVGLGHTRWATHGAPTDPNAHPHTDCTGRLAVVHNGIIENFAALRAGAAVAGHVLASETDSEVVAHLLEAELAALPGPASTGPASTGPASTGPGQPGALAEAMRRVCRRLEGAFTLVAVDVRDHGAVVGARRNSPLVVGRGEKENFLASDVAAFIAYTRSAVELGQDQVAEIRADSVHVTRFDGTPADVTEYQADWDISAAEKAGFDYFKLKELAYMHAEGFAAGELKHGPIALIEDGLPVVVVVPPAEGRGVLHDKIVSNIQEVRARGARVVVAEEGDHEVKPYADTLIEVPHVPTLLQPLVITVPLQVFACELATAKGHDVDQPRNLAKSVTVE